jgi:3-phosphoshikimate 1-carboxyvinyltransferase
MEMREKGTSGGEPVADILVKPSSLEGTKVTPDEVPLMIDELPILAVAAARANGLTEVRGAVELRVKESDRIRSMAIGLRKLGVDIEELSDGWKIRGPANIVGGRVRSYGDHRVAMALAVAALFSAEPVEIAGDACVDISYPGFFDVLEGLSLRRENS